MVSQSWGCLGGPGVRAQLSPLHSFNIPQLIQFSVLITTTSWQMTPELSSSQNLYIKLDLRPDMVGMAYLCSMKSEAGKT